MTVFNNILCTDLSSAPEGHQENYSELVALFVELNLTAVRISSYEDELSTLAGSSNSSIVMLPFTGRIH